MKNKLEEYKQKRNFASTSEPKGQVIKTTKQKKTLKFIIQHHLARRDHYDFRLEYKGVLLSWAIPKGPSFNPRDKRLAIQVEDHPLDYATFEGTIPPGQYGGGTVMLWDEGSWSSLNDFSKALKDGSLKLVLKGQRLKGTWALVRLKNEQNWLFIKEQDEYAKTSEGISRFTKSIKTKRTMNEIANEMSPHKLDIHHRDFDVQLAKLVEEIPQDENWAYEIKFDGYRTIAFIEPNAVKLQSRNKLDFTSKFAAILSDLQKLSAFGSTILDGEMVVIDKKGKTDFQALQSYFKKPEEYRVTYMVFDLLALNGDDLRNLPLLKRKAKLANLLKKAPSSIVYSEHIIGNGEQVYKYAEKLELEGIIGKRLDSSYAGKRNGDWIKLKCRKQQEFVIGGYVKSSKSKRMIKSLLIGYYNEKQLIYAGRVGSGFDESDDQELMKKFKKIETSHSPFREKNIQKNEKVIWLNPKLICEVQFAEWTKSDQLRQASFISLRIDKKSKEVVKERSDSRETCQGIKITNPQKIVFDKPKVTKSDIINYYDLTSKRMFPYLEKRLLSVVRCHNGINASCFFKKHPTKKNSGIAIKTMTKDGKSEEYFYVKSTQGIISEVQLGTIEFHTWGSTTTKLEKPNIMVFDLDPDQNMSLEKVRQGARDLKTVLDELKLTSFLKTSGGKGYHIVVPFVAKVNWDIFRNFARQVAEYMEEKWPDRYTSNMRKVHRKGRIFVDWLRNSRGATSVAPYSLRARKGAGISMPIAWDELDDINPNGIDITEALKRMKKSDPWENFFAIKQYLK